MVIPSGGFILRKGDIITILATQEKAAAFFGRLGMPTRPVRSALIVGGGTIGYYLAKDLLAHDIRVRIVEHDTKRCEELAETLPVPLFCTVTAPTANSCWRKGFLWPRLLSLSPISMRKMSCLALFAKKHSNAKLVTKINRLEFDDILEGLDIGSAIYPKYLICDFIVQHVRALQNEAGSNIKTLYRILDDRVEALEFTVHEASHATGVPLSELKLKTQQLVCCITRGDQIIIPSGSDSIQVGDSVIVVTLEHGLHDLRDIVKS